MIPDNLITPHGTNIPNKYRKCDNATCDTYVMCPWSFCKKHHNNINIVEWSDGCNCNGKYNSETFKCAVCKVE
jgi:hypothetical protein